VLLARSSCCATIRHRSSCALTIDRQSSPKLTISDGEHACLAGRRCCAAPALGLGLGLAAYDRRSAR
jgi:hypothetical protein